MMDTKRLVLYILLGVVVFGLWQAWQQDYPSAPVAVTSSTTASTATTATASTSSATTVAGVANGNTARAITAGDQVVTRIPKNRLVRVHTDVLDVAIDTVGGNLVESKLLKYPQVINQPEPVQMFSDDPAKLYLAESGLVSSVGPDAIDKQAQYTVSQREYNLASGQKELQVRLLWKNNGLNVAKVFNFTSGSYAIKVSYEIDNHSSQQWDGQFFAQLKRQDYKEETSMFRASTYNGASISSPEKNYEKITYANLAKTGLDRQIKGGWVALQQHYFLSAWVPPEGNALRYYGNGKPEQIFTVGFEDKNVTVPAGNKAIVGATLYVGPEISQNLVAVAPSLKLTIDYGWLWMISAALFWIMQYLYSFIGNWGWSIVLVTLLIKAAFFKLSESSYRSMARMKDLAPKIQALKERFGDDKQKLSQSTMELYRTEKINPLGGCLPMLIQIPVFIGLYYMLIEAVQLRQAPFIFWIHDLSFKDPFYVLPVLTGLSMFVQQRLGPQSPDPMQAKMMMILFPLMFAFISLSFPSGLVLYFFVNNCVSILQQWYINKRMVHFHAKKTSSKASSSHPKKK